MAYVPHNFFEPPDDTVHRTPEAHQDEAAALARADRSPASAFVALGLALAGLVALYLGSSFLLVRLLLAAATIVASAFAWRAARRQHRPSGFALASLALGSVAALVALALYW
jgi:hypothetical protein